MRELRIIVQNHLGRPKKVYEVMGSVRYVGGFSMDHLNAWITLEQRR